VHLLEAEDADRARAFLGSRLAGAKPEALEGVEIGEFISDRVLGHRRERVENAEAACGPWTLTIRNTASTVA
jgi:hypothetical protein